MLDLYNNIYIYIHTYLCVYIYIPIYMCVYIYMSYYYLVINTKASIRCLYILVDPIFGWSVLSIIWRQIPVFSHAQVEDQDPVVTQWCQWLQGHWTPVRTEAIGPSQWKRQQCRKGPLRLESLGFMRKCRKIWTPKPEIKWETIWVSIGFVQMSTVYWAVIG